MADRTIYHCTSCGAELSSKNARRSFSPRFKACFARGIDEPVLPVCSPCLGAEFNKLNTYYGERKIAIFYFAIFYDLPIYRDHIKKLPDSDAFLNKWFNAVEPYCAAFEEVSFRDGDITKLEDLNIKGKTKPDEEQGGNRWPGCVEAREEWNIDDLSYPDYKRLETLKSEQLSSRPFLDATAMAAIREYCKAALFLEKAMKEGDSKRTKDWQDVAKKALERESLLKAQASQTELDRPAGFIDYIEKKIGAIPSLRELLDWMFVVVPELYGYNITADAADVALNDLENHYRENDGQLPLIERPPDKKLKDRLNEFIPPEKQPESERYALALIREYVRAGSFDEMDFSVLDEESDNAQG